MPPSSLKVISNEELNIVLPPRSRLHALEPIGVGTPYVESLSGYISRLAQSYQVTTGTLLCREIAHTVITGSPKEGEDFSYTTEKLSQRTVNGASRTSQAVAVAMSKLTGWPSYQDLTLFKWGLVLRPQNLIRVKRAWCPECYQDASESGREAYEQLLWSIAEVNVCPIHRTALLNQCSYCGKTQNSLASRTAPGYCAKCQAWLGARRCADEPGEWDLWRANAVGEMLASSPSLNSPQSPKHIPTSLIALARANGFKKDVPLAKYLGFDRSIIDDWKNGRCIFGLDSLLVVCAKLGSTPRKFLAGVSLPDCSPRFRECLRKGPVRISYAEAKARLLKAYESWVPSESMHHLCDRAGVNRHTIRLELPHLAQKIKELRTKYVQDCRAKKKGELADEVRSIIALLKGKGEKVSVSKIVHLLSRQGVMRAPWGREVVFRVLAEEHQRSEMPAAGTV